MANLDIRTVKNEVDFVEGYKEVVARLDQNGNLAATVVGEVERVLGAESYGLVLGQKGLAELPVQAEETRWVVTFEQIVAKNQGSFRRHTLGEALARIAYGSELCWWYGNTFAESYSNCNPEELCPTAKVSETLTECIVRTRNEGYRHWTAFRDDEGHWLWREDGRRQAPSALDRLTTAKLEILIELLSRHTPPPEPKSILEKRLMTLTRSGDVVPTLKAAAETILSVRQAREAQVLANLREAIAQGGLASKLPKALLNLTAADQRT